MSEPFIKYTGIDGWHAAEQDKWDREARHLVAERRRKRLADQALRPSKQLADTDPGATSQPAPAPPKSITAPAQAPQTPEVRATGEHPLAASFEEAHRVSGNSINDVLTAIDTAGIDLEDKWGGNPFDKYVFSRALRRVSPEEIAFFRIQSPENLVDYDTELVEFTNRIRRENPHPGKDNTSEHIGWMEHSSKPFMEDRLNDQSHDKPTARIYLTPKFSMDMIRIYKEIFTQAEQAGLRFKAKVYDPSIHGDDKRIEKFKNFYTVEKQRTDPMVFYPFEESKDALLGIVNEVYTKYANAFKGMHTGAIPVETAPGLAVGSEPKGFSGVESLTSHRERLGAAFNIARSDPRWTSASHITKLAICRQYLQQVAEENNIDSENIAFDAH